MKFIIYLYYLLYKFMEHLGRFLYEHSPLTPKNKTDRKGEETLRLQIIFYTYSLFTMGELLYSACILLFLYLMGVKQVVMIANKDYKWPVVISFVIISGTIDYFFLERNDRFEKYSEEFRHFTFEQKALYGMVALFLFLLPLFVLIYEIGKL
jgi:hypothetical protein